MTDENRMQEEFAELSEETGLTQEPETAEKEEPIEEAQPAEEELPELSEEESLAAIEAILFAMGKAVEPERIAGAINQPLDVTLAYIEKLNEEYQQKRRGIFINFLENKVQLCTKKEFYPHLIRIAAQPKKPVLTQTVLETLSIVAYKQPVTKGDIERIRGVKSDFAVNKLVEYGLIEEVGRLDAPGRPILFATTEEFLRRFGVNSVETLPQAQPEQIEEFENEARQEITV